MSNVRVFVEDISDGTGINAKVKPVDHPALFVGAGTVERESGKEISNVSSGSPRVS